MTPGTKVRTKVAVTEYTGAIAAGSTGVVVADYEGHPYPVVVLIDGRNSGFQYRSDELEIIE